jgi:hypothetical protein
MDRNAGLRVEVRRAMTARDGPLLQDINAPLCLRKLPRNNRAGEPRTYYESTQGFTLQPWANRDVEESVMG